VAQNILGDHTCDHLLFYHGEHHKALVMDFVQRIDWMNHDGVNLPMINDFVRNQFYDRVLARYVSGQHCTDIGFGTGLLTMMALKHGASHVRAFESDPDRYLLGREVVDRLGLGSQVELINERYDRGHDTTPVTFTETVNGNLWWEGLWNTLPIDSNTQFLPGTYFAEIWAVTVPRRFAAGLCRTESQSGVFNPAVDVDSRFVDLINSFRSVQALPDSELPRGLVHFERQRDTDWGWIPYMRAVQHGAVIAQYSVQQYLPDMAQFEMTVDTRPWQDQCVLIVPRMGMQQDHDRLYLDTGHWGAAESPVLLIEPQQRLRITHNVTNGHLNYYLED
jgi:hypothetical protein